MADQSHKCCVRVFAGSFVGHMCTKTAKVERDGRWYCGIHDPITVNARDEKRREAWQQKLDADKERREAPARKLAELEAEIERNRAAIAELVALAQKLVDRWDSPINPSEGSAAELIDEFCAAITKHTTTTKGSN